ncbi:FHA domain-containing protein [Streptacidiphilus anmyonensis]|uniref:FHA domain-containing protein n=1 Tax=Streptacidiphilus anmyonensis TaxID=405782 RepID=UPI000AB65D5D|nr:FHA domain-containing protein [Streptacidiphilus anmyonensis]
MSLFSKLFGRKSREGAAVEAPTARHRRADAEYGAGVPGMRAPEADSYTPAAERPLFRDEDGRHAGVPSGGPIASQPVPSSSGGGFAADPYSQGQSGDPRQEAAGVTLCTRCGYNNPESARFCSNCGAPLRARVGGAERPSETTSTISISGLEAYEPEAPTQVPGLSPEAQAAVDALPPGSALLVVRRGPNSGSRFLLDTDLTTAGRHPESDIFLDDITVSRRHVEFRRHQGGAFTVADVGSLNGTYVNREQIDEVPLNTGDEVQIGKYRLVFFAARPGY